MAVTDLTDSLPWWARGGAGPTGGPGAAPMGAGGPDGQAWLQYLSQMYGISPDQAAMMMQGGSNPANMPSPNATPMEADNPHGDGPPGPVSPFAVPPGPPPITNFGNPAPTNGPGPGNVGPVNLNAANPPPRPIIASSVGRGPPVGAGLLDQSGVQRGPMGVLRTQPGASAPVGAGLPDQSGVTRNPAGVLTPGAPATPSGTGPAAPVAAPATRVPGPMAGGGAAAVGATSNPRFVGIDAPNFNPQNSINMRGGPQGTALNLAGLFGGGGQNPNVPAANAQPVAAQRPVPGPLASDAITMNPAALGSAVSKPNWWQQFGRPDMTADQIARAVKKPNWWQHL